MLMSYRAFNRHLPMPMHCPNCRRDNAATTRFCTSCGAVLVESTPSGGRRRVLRPWGLRHSAPLTESPDMPELAAARQEALRDGRSGRRIDHMVAAGVTVIVLAGLVVYPYANADETGIGTRIADRPTSRAEAVAVPALSTVRETAIAAPPLVEPSTVAVPKARVVKPSIEPTTRPAARPAPEPAVVATVLEREAVIVGDAKVAEAPPRAPATPAAAVDPWHALRSTLHTCAASDGLWSRATCEHRARLAHCDGHWGIHALCPSGRTEYGQ